MPQLNDLELAKFDIGHPKFPAVIGVAESHFHINNGRAFVAGDIFPSIPNNGFAYGLFQTTKEMHTFLSAASQGEFEIHLWEDVTFSAAGTPMVVFNKNRSSTIPSGATVTHTPTITDFGIELPPKFAAGGTGGIAQGGEASTFSSEIVLAAGKNYLFGIKNTSGLVANMMGRLEWYEPDAVAP